jgi:hypothetical protein
MEEKVGVGDGIQQYSDSADRGASSEAENTIYWKTTASASGSASGKSNNVMLQDVTPIYVRDSYLLPCSLFFGLLDERG